MAFRIKGWHILFVILLLFAAIYTGFIKIEWTTVPPESELPSVEKVSVNKPVKFYLGDPLRGEAIASASIYIYDQNKVLLETLITGSDGTVTSSLPYQSDTIIRVKVEKSGYVTRWFAITVPRMSPADAESLTSNYVALQTYYLGTYTIKVTDQFGNSYTSGGTLNFTALGAETVSVTFTIYNTEDNSGYISSYDFLNGINLNAAFLTSTSGSSVTVTGAGSSVLRGTTTYWITIVDDEGLTRQLVGNTYVKPGVTSVTITFGKGSLTSGSSQSFTFTLYVYFDQDYFATNGIGGPDATSLATFSLTLAA